MEDPPGLDTPGMDTPRPTWTTCTHMDGLKSLDTPGKFGHTWSLLWILLDNSYGFF